MFFEEMQKIKSVLIFDGGMGSELGRRGSEMSGTACISSPETVLAIHLDYVRAGADLLTANTFSMNEINAGAKDREIDVREANRAGVMLARKAAGSDRLVFGDIGPTGQLLQPYGVLTEEEVYCNYRKQAAVLAEEGVDGFIVETFTDLREAKCALKACRDTADLPLVLTLSFSTAEKGGRTIMGDTAAGAVEAAEEYGVSAVGANCGDIDPSGMALIVEILKKITRLPVIVQANAGRPRLVDGETRYDMPPEEYARGAIKCVKAGASIVGGCCGTTPDHIKAVSVALSGG